MEVTEKVKMHQTKEQKPIMKSRKLTDRIENYSETIEGQCSCGTPVLKTLNSDCTNRVNGDRFHYPNNKSPWGIFSCINCGELISKSWTTKKRKTMNLTTKIKQLSDHELADLSIEMIKISKELAPANAKKSELLNRLFEIANYPDYWLGQFHNIAACMRSEIVSRYIDKFKTP